MKRVLRLISPEVRRRACEAIHEAPEGDVVTITSPTRSGDQNALLHALLTEIAAEHEWVGSKRDVETWKRLMTAAWLRARGESIEILPALDGHGVDVVFRRTSSLTKTECSELVEFIQCWEAEHAVA